MLQCHNLPKFISHLLPLRIHLKLFNDTLPKKCGGEWPRMGKQQQLRFVLDFTSVEARRPLLPENPTKPLTLC